MIKTRTVMPENLQEEFMDLYHELGEKHPELRNASYDDINKAFMEYLKEHASKELKEYM